MTPPPASRPSRPDDEALYRAHFLRADARRTALVLGMTIGATVVFVRNDLRFFGWSSRLFALLAVRGVAILVYATAIWVLLRSTIPRRHDRAVAVALAVLALANTYVVSTRPPDYVGHGVITLVAVSVAYFVILGPLSVRAVFAATMSVATFWFAVRMRASPEGLTAVMVAHAVMHAIGIPVARRLELARSEAFFAQLEEQRARAELTAKAADLEVARERAEDLARTKSHFLATMSHEFRTPMNAVLGLSGVLADTPLRAEQREIVRTIHQSASSLLVLLNDILDLAKIDAGRMDVELEPFSVREVLESAVDVIRHQAAQKSLLLDVTIQPEVPAGLAGDAARLRQVLVNLLSNAVKFTRRGTISVRGSARALAGDEHEVVLAVQDTGVGMAPELLARLFSPFEQGSANGAQAHAGTGLGLAISRRLVQLMGGSIDVQSDVGRGSTFEITLRARAAVPPPRRPSRAEIPRVDRCGDLAILLVEDNVVNQQVARAMLARLGARADVANDGREALEAIEQKEYELILMDLRMPEMDGLEAARRILARVPPDRRPRIVAMTASAFEDDRIACQDAGMDGFISKPVELEELAAVLSRAVSQRAPGAREGAADAVLATGTLDKLRQLEAPDAPGFFADVCRQFVDDAGKRLSSLERAASSGDAETAERDAHSLKSMSAMVGATRLSEMCGALEVAANAGDLSAHPAAVERVRAELGRVARALAKEAG